MMEKIMADMFDDEPGIEQTTDFDRKKGMNLKIFWKPLICTVVQLTLECDGNYFQILIGLYCDLMTVDADHKCNISSLNSILIHNPSCPS